MNAHILMCKAERGELVKVKISLLLLNFCSFNLMKNWIWFTVLALIFVHCAQKKKPDPFDPAAYLTMEKQNEIKEWAVRHIEKPPVIPPDQRFDPKYDSFYRTLVDQYRLDGYQKHQEDEYFLVSKPATGEPFKRVATCGRMHLVGQSMKHYREFFRTKKLTEAELGSQAPLLFELVVLGGAIGENQYPSILDYPNSITYFDTTVRAWRRKSVDAN